MYDLLMLHSRLESARDCLPDDPCSQDLHGIQLAEEELTSLIESCEPDGDMTCGFCSEPFSDWFERTLHYDTCQSIPRNRRKQ